MHPAWQHPAVWQGDELLQRPDWRWEFTRDELVELQSLVPCGPLRTQPIEELSLAKTHTPQLAAKMAAIQEALEQGAGAVLLQGFPIHELEPQAAAAAFWRLMLMIGTPVPQTANRQQLFRVQDEGFARDHPQSGGPVLGERYPFIRIAVTSSVFFVWRSSIRRGKPDRELDGALQLPIEGASRFVAGAL